MSAHASLTLGQTAEHGVAGAITKRRPQGRPWPIHVLFLPAVPVLALWSGNAGEVHSLFPAWLALWSVVGTLVLVAIVSIVQRDVRRTAMIASLVALEFGIHGHVIPMEGWVGLPLAGLLIALVATVAARMPIRLLRTVTHVLNTVAVALVFANLVVIILNRPNPGTAPLTPPIDIAAPTDGPDVWYIAPDRYPDLSLLEDEGIDTGGFGRALIERGFSVLEDARANYPSTNTSLASAWNAQLLDAPSGPPSEGTAVRALEDPLIGQWFRDAGYSYHHLGTWFDSTASSASASTVLTLQLGPEFFRAYQQHTILPTLRAVTGADWNVVGDVRDRQVKHARHQLRTLQELARRDPAEPEFVLTHLTLPHRPYVFNADGSLRTRPMTKANAYEAQLQFFNDYLLSIIDLLQERRDPPLIVLLPDEGLYPEDLNDTLSKGDYDTASLTPSQARAKLSITAAIFDPSPSEDVTHPPGTTAVNIVRSVLNRALGAQLEQLPDVSYTWSRTADGTNVLTPTDH